MLNSGGIKLSSCQSLISKIRGCVDAGPGGIPHVARFIQPRIEHQRDRQKNRTQSWNGQEIPTSLRFRLHPKRGNRNPVNWMAIKNISRPDFKDKSILYPAKRIYREIQEKGFTGKYTIVKDFVRDVRPKSPVHAVYRYETKPGIQSQVDWAECGRIDIDNESRKLYCFTMVLGYSRMRYGRVHATY